MNPDRSLDAAGVLAAARRLRNEADAIERARLENAIAWASLHEVDPGDPASRAVATWDDTPVAITGEGAPLIGEFCIAEFAAALGMRTGAGRQYLADAVELAHRLPRLLEQVRIGRAPVFKARRIAQRTIDLTLEGAAYVDSQVALTAGRISLAAVERLVDEARARFQPEEAAELARRSAERRHVTIDTRQVSYDGTSIVYAEADLADVLDLDATLDHISATLTEDYPDLTRDALRAKALGILARGQHVSTRSTNENSPTTNGDGSGGEGTGGDSTGGAPGPQTRRDLTLFVHLSSNGETLDPTAYLETGKHLLVLDQIRDWASTATQITIRPVIDLHDDLSVTGYRIPDRIAERVTLRDRTCVFPFCERNARHCDTDHTEPYDPHGPPGQTATHKLAPLCRHHHRLKTHAGWHYTTIEPGAYHWQSPHGLTYLVDNTGTRELTAPPLAPPRVA